MGLIRSCKKTLYFVGIVTNAFLSALCLEGLGFIQCIYACATIRFKQIFGHGCLLLHTVSGHLVFSGTLSFLIYGTKSKIYIYIFVVQSSLSFTEVKKVFSSGIK